jgi:hypothetical protein
MHIQILYVRIRTIYVFIRTDTSILKSCSIHSLLHSLHFSYLICELATGPVWTFRKKGRRGEVVIMPATRGWERIEANKTAGDMAAGLQCNIWARAQSPAKLTYAFIKGHIRSGRRKGFQMHELAWTEASPFPPPQWRLDHPILQFLGPKIVHFIVDFHMDWIGSLNLPASDGRHRQLDARQVQQVLDRLETIVEVQSEVQIYTGVKIGHEEYSGAQIVHCTPFKSRHINTRMVRVLVCIELYVSVYVCIEHLFLQSIT